MGYKKLCIFCKFRFDNLLGNVVSFRHLKETKTKNYRNDLQESEKIMKILTKEETKQTDLNPVAPLEILDSCPTQQKTYHNKNFVFPNGSHFPHLPCSVCGKLSRIMNDLFKSPYTLCDEHLAEYLKNMKSECEKDIETDEISDNEENTMKATTTNNTNKEINVKEDLTTNMENPAPIQVGDLVITDDVLADLEREEELKKSGDYKTPGFSDRFYMRKIDELVLHDNIREDVGDEESLRVLGESIKKHGLMQPIVVQYFRGKPGVGEWCVVAGQRRFLAAKLVGLEEIPARSIKSTISAEEITCLQWIENEHRKEMTLYEKAQTVRLMRDEYGKEVAEIAHDLGLSQKKVKIMLRMWNLIPELQELVKSCVIWTPSILEMLITLPNSTQLEIMDDYHERSSKEFFSVRELRRHLQNKRQGVQEQTQPLPIMSEVGYPTTEHVLKEERSFEPQVNQRKARLVCNSGDFLEMVEIEDGVVKIKMNGNVVGTLDLSGTLEVPHLSVKVKDKSQVIIDA